MIKKIAIAIWIVTALFLGILVANYYGNRQLIENYGEGIYQQNELGFLGFTQPFINHFNRGNVFYKLKDYEKAKQEYQMALNLNPEDPYECKIRVNYALAYVADIDVDDIEEQDEIDEAVETIEAAKEILLEDGCATKENSGHYYAAQKLYNELCQQQEEISNKNNPTPTPTSTPTPTPGGENGTSTPTPSPKPDADATDTPTPTPEGTPTPSDGTPTPTDSATPTPGDGTPTPTPGGEDQGTPTPTPGGEGTGTPTPTPGGEGNGTPTPTPGGEGNGTPTPTPGGNGPTPTMTPEEKVKNAQERGNQERTGSGGEGEGYNFGDTASW